MTTNKTALTAQEVAARFNELGKQEKWFQIHEELFPDNVRRVEPKNSPYLKCAEGKSPVRKKGGELMRKIQAIAVIVGLLFSLAASSQNKQTPGVMNKIQPLPRDLEIQLGAKPSFDDAYPFLILQGPHGYTIQNLGEEARQNIRKEYEELLGRLCEIYKEWCLPKENAQDQAPMHHHN